MCLETALSTNCMKREESTEKSPFNAGGAGITNNTRPDCAQAENAHLESVTHEEE